MVRLVRTRDSNPRILDISSTLWGGRHNGAVCYQGFSSMELSGVSGYGRFMRELAGQTSGESPGQKGPVICSRLRQTRAFQAAARWRADSEVGGRASGFLRGLVQGPSRQR